MRRKNVVFWRNGLLTVFLFLLFALPAVGQTVDVYWDEVRQEIDGFGASAAFRQADNLKDFPTADREEILKLLFSQTEGIGLSIVRNMVGDGSQSEWGDSIDGPVDTIEPQRGVWDFDADDQQIWFMKEAAARGCTRFISTVWSPPRWMKSNNSCIYGGTIPSNMYGDYAEYLHKYIAEYLQERNDITLYGISVANEPDQSTGYSSCLWSGDQFRNFVGNYLGPTLRNAGLDTKIIIGEHSHWDETPAQAALNDSTASEYVDIVAAHNYGGSSYSSFYTASSKNKKVWETEVSNLGANDTSMTDGMRWAREIHNFFINARGNAWCYWWAICYKVNPAKGEALINLNTSNKTWYTNKRLYTMGNFSRFVRPGWYRIKTSTSSSNGVLVSAFKDLETDDFVVVAINTSYNSQNFQFSLDGHSVETVVPYITSSSENLREHSPITASGGVFQDDLPANSVTTFHGIGNVTPVFPGDVNGDEEITVVDALMIAQFVIGLSPQGFIEANADVDEDGEITLIDALKVAQFYVGVIDSF